MAYTGAPSLPYSKLGIVEDSDTASRAISKDAYVIWKGGNYFAKTDILQGATFVVDTNLTAIPDGVVNGILSSFNNNIGAIIRNRLTQIYAGPLTAGTYQIPVDLTDYSFIIANIRYTYRYEYECRFILISDWYRSDDTLQSIQFSLGGYFNIQHPTNTSIAFNNINVSNVEELRLYVI